MVKISALPEDSSPTTDDFTVSLDTGSATTKKAKWENVMKMASAYVLPNVYPVGSIYTGTVSTNPATLFGFGTWAAFGQGQVLVGIAASGTFATAGATGGEETHTLSGGEMPSHSHGVNDPGHNHYSIDPGTGQAVFTAGSTNHTTTSGSAQQISWGNTTTSNNGSNISIQNSGGGGAHNNLQPYIVVYMWQRTA